MSLALCANVCGEHLITYFPCYYTHINPPKQPTHTVKFASTFFSARARPWTSCALSYQIVIFLVFIIFKHMPWENIIIMYRRHGIQTPVALRLFVLTCVHTYIHTNLEWVILCFSWAACFVYICDISWHRYV